jgi:ADP-heptose:LPS heptosyltransferase
MLKLPEYKKIIVIMLDHIGDVIWALPALDNLRLLFPEAQIDALVTAYTKPVLENHPVLSKIWAYPYPYPKAKREKLEFIKPIQSESYDLALVLDPRDEANFLAWLSRAPVRAGYYYNDKPISILKGSYYLTRRFLHPAHRALKPIPHEVEVNLQLLKDLGWGKDFNTEVTLPLDEELSAFALNYLAGMGLDPAKPILAIHVSNACETPWFNEVWKPEYLYEFLDKLKSKFPALQLLISIGPKEQELHSRIEAKLQALKIPVITGLTIKQWAAVISKVKVFLSTDTGVVHVASAVKVPVISIFKMSKKDLKSRWTPYSPANVSLLREENPKNYMEATLKLQEELLDALAKYL